MLKLTRHYDLETIYVSAAHIVFLLPGEKGEGCYVETVNDTNYDQSPVRVREPIEEIASHPLLNPQQ